MSWATDQDGRFIWTPDGRGNPLVAGDNTTPGGTGTDPGAGQPNVQPTGNAGASPGFPKGGQPYVNPFKWGGTMPGPGQFQDYGPYSGPSDWWGVPFLQYDTGGHPLSKYLNLLDQYQQSRTPLQSEINANRWNFGGPDTPTNPRWSSPQRGLLSGPSPIPLPGPGNGTGGGTGGGGDIPVPPIPPGGSPRGVPTGGAPTPPPPGGLLEPGPVRGPIGAPNPQTQPGAGGLLGPISGPPPATPVTPGFEGGWGRGTSSVPTGSVRGPSAPGSTAPFGPYPPGYTPPAMPTRGPAPTPEPSNIPAGAYPGSPQFKARQQATLQALIAPYINQGFTPPPNGLLNLDADYFGYTPPEGYFGSHVSTGKGHGRHNPGLLAPTT